MTNTNDTKKASPIDYLVKVEGLLAKAQSTEFPAEAEALVAKAQELMTKHAIDQVMLDERNHHKTDKVEGLTITIHAPYASAKSLLLHCIAKANGCDSVRTSMGAEKLMTVVGFRSDLENVQALYGALSLYATNDMLKHRPAFGETVKGFRHSYLVSFACRIGDRLEQARRTATQEAAAIHDRSASGSDRSVALVLVERKEQVAVALREMFPKTTKTRASVSSRSGVSRGAAAADRANLGQRGLGASSKALGR